MNKDIQAIADKARPATTSMFKLAKLIEKIKTNSNTQSGNYTVYIDETSLETGEVTKLEVRL